MVHRKPNIAVPYSYMKYCNQPPWMLGPKIGTQFQGLGIYCRAFVRYCASLPDVCILYCPLYLLFNWRDFKRRILLFKRRILLIQKYRSLRPFVFFINRSHASVYRNTYVLYLYIHERTAPVLLLYRRVSEKSPVHFSRNTNLFCTGVILFQRLQ